MPIDLPSGEHMEISNIPTIDDRVLSGASVRLLADKGIVPFAYAFEPDGIGQWLTKPSMWQLDRLVNDGWRLTRFDAYHDANGQIIMAAVRLDHPTQGKQVLPLRARDRTVRFLEFKAIEPPRPIFALNILAARPNASVVVVEGEKAAKAAQRLFADRVATTWPGGAPAVDKADWRSLAGREVTIWPDHDPAGAAAAIKLATILSNVGASVVRIVDVPASFPAKWDLADPLPEVANG